jgi:hypothetical protein
VLPFGSDAEVEGAAWPLSKNEIPNGRNGYATSGGKLRKKTD